LNLRNLLRPGARHGTREPRNTPNTRKQGVWEPRNTPNTRKQGVWEPRNTPNTRKQEITDCGLFLGGESRELVPFELFRNTGKTCKSSVPVLSAQKPWFSQGFWHFGEVPLAFLPIHACPCLQVLGRLVRCLGPW
jgi:hypothetical protein